MTRPKEIAPFHMLRMMPSYPVTAGADTRSVVRFPQSGNMSDAPGLRQ
jgi:hypothetical protein